MPWADLEAPRQREATEAMGVLIHTHTHPSPSHSEAVAGRRQQTEVTAPYLTQQWRASSPEVAAGDPLVLRTGVTEAEVAGSGSRAVISGILAIPFLPPAQAE